MAQFVAFLRAINVTGRFVKMAELAGQARALGLDGVQTPINSGNVIFLRVQPARGVVAVQHAAEQLSFC